MNRDVFDRRMSRSVYCLVVAGVLVSLFLVGMAAASSSGGSSSSSSSSSAAGSGDNTWGGGVTQYSNWKQLWPVYEINGQNVYLYETVIPNSPSAVSGVVFVMSPENEVPQDENEVYEPSKWGLAKLQILMMVSLMGAHMTDEQQQALLAGLIPLIENAGDDPKLVENVISASSHKTEVGLTPLQILDYLSRGIDPAAAELDRETYSDEEYTARANTLLTIVNNMANGVEYEAADIMNAFGPGGISLGGSGS